jgi:hypothetical protein
MRERPPYPEHASTPYGLSMRLAVRRLVPFVDQGFLSTSALTLNVAVAQVANVEEFGVFGSAFLLYVLWQGALRGLAAEPLVIFARDRIANGVAASGAVTLALFLGSVCGALLATLAITVLSPEYRNITLAFATVIPLHAVSDAVRYWAIGDQRPTVAAALTGSGWWLQVSATVLLLWWGPVSPAPLIFAWGLMAIPSIAWLLARRFRMECAAAVAWWKRYRGAGFRYATEWLLAAGSTTGVLLVMSVVSGGHGAAGIRGAQTMFGPMVVLTAGATTAALAMALRVDPTGALYRRSMIKTSAYLAAAVLALTGLLLSLPDEIGALIMSDSWPATRDLLAPFAATVIASNLTVGAIVGLKALQAPNLSLRLRLCTVAGICVAGLLGYRVSGVTGGLFGLAVMQLASGGAWWSVFVRVQRRRS